MVRPALDKPQFSLGSRDRAHAGSTGTPHMEPGKTVADILVEKLNRTFIFDRKFIGS